MPLIRQSYGKGRVRVMRVARDGDRHEPRELDVLVMLEGDFAASYTDGDNARVVATDTIKNIVNIVAREQVAACAEAFGQALADRLLSRYPQIERVVVSVDETRWLRASVDGVAHDHAFTLDGNGRGYARVEASRSDVRVASGVSGYTFMKTTGSGWVGYVMDDVTTLPETIDRIAATAMDARWTWSRAPADYPAANAVVLATMLDVFATTYSRGVQDSLFRMAEAALAKVPELGEITMACPNKHYLPMRLEPFGLSSDGLVFTPTDEPHGQIECAVGR